uniref:Uncharacterized protein n=1 Tax=Romanomermis culicivorax TaxID=13658 RepID=A0A915KPJ2_ROMCU
MDDVDEMKIDADGMVISRTDPFKLFGDRDFYLHYYHLETLVENLSVCYTTVCYTTQLSSQIVIINPFHQILKMCEVVNRLLPKNNAEYNNDWEK